MFSPSWPCTLALALLVAGCGPSPLPAARNLIVVSIDTLRADMLGCYGEERPTSPFIDSLAARGVVFEHAMATSPWTLPSHASLLTGLYPSRHGVKTERTKLGAPLQTLAETLAAAGFLTAAVVNSTYLSRRYGFAQGFGRYEYVGELPSSPEPAALGDALAEVLSPTPAAGRFFLFLHSYDVHSDYTSRPEFEAPFLGPYGGTMDGTTRQLAAVRRGERAMDEADRDHVVALYQAGIRQLDAELERHFAALDERGLLDETLIVVTSDHGEEFLEHGDVLHGRTQFDEVARVPLIVVGPGIPAGVRVSTPVSLVDVFPTALAVLGLEHPAPVDGVDVSALWGGGEPPPELQGRPVFGEADHNRARPDSTRAIRWRNFKLCFDRVTGATRLYDLESDPLETRDVRAAHPEIAETLRGRLAEFMATEVRGAAAPELDARARDRLRALGYLE